MMRKRNILSVLLVFTMLISVCCVPSAVLAGDGADSFTAEDVYYFNDFAAASDLPSGTVPDGFKSEITLSAEDGATTVWRQYGTSTKVTSAHSTVTTITEQKDENGNLKDLALEYRVRLNLDSKERNYGSFLQTPKANGVNSVYFGGSSAYNVIKGSMSDPNTESWGEWPSDEWFTVTVLYGADEDKRSIYLDGVLLAEVLPVNEASGTDRDGNYTNYWKQMQKLPLKIWYQGNQNTYMEMDYLKIYEPAETLDFTVLHSGGADTGSLQLQFNANMPDLTTDNITINGVPAASVTKTNTASNIYTVVPGNALNPSSAYTVSVNDAKDLFGNSLTKERAFRTRDAQLVVSGIGIYSGDAELGTAQTGTLTVKADIRNEFEETENAAVLAAQYGTDGKMSADLFCEEISAEAGFSGNVLTEENNTIEAAEGTAEIQVFVWKSGDTPIPVSGYKKYMPDGREQKDYDPLLAAYTGTDTLSAAIKEDYSGLNITVSIPAGQDDRFTGVLVKDKDGTPVYASQGMTEEGTAVFSVPLDEKNVGTYTVAAGVQNRGVLSTSLDYYSPNYIAGMIETNINAETADTDSVSEFTAALGEYLKMDTDGLKQLNDPDIAYQILLNIRDTFENKIFLTQADIVSAFATAVKMAKIYEGTDAVELISESNDLEIGTEVLEVFNNGISADAQTYVADKLKGTNYSIPADMTEDVKKYTILGGVYHAESYKQVRSLIQAFGGEIGVNMDDYRALNSPEKVDQKIRGNEYSDLDAFAGAVNTQITAVRKSENAGSSNAGSSGTGGSGIGSIGFPAVTTPAPTVKPKPETYSFSDVGEKDWFYNEVMWGAEQKLFIGTPDGRFMPDTNLTWEHITIVLGRMGFEMQNEHGQEDISRGDFAELLFRFLAEDGENVSSQEWVMEQRLFIGNADGDMMFDKPLTRAECCTVLRRIEK